MSSRLTVFLRPLLQMGLIPQITIGIIAGVLLALISPQAAGSVSLLGQLFITALTAVAPILVFVLVAAAIAISVITLAAANTLGIPVDFPTALLLCVISAVAACGVSGVAMQVVAIGFVISVVQDSTETALNSSTDVLFTAAACHAAEDRAG
ncbi:hypothetical protein GCM10011362_25210 [Marinobacter halophilus]|uniref:Serine/threonine transporter SstT n=1 Tax=Marinobacter halophilus TaxID=1323740 RepID=A0A2T1KB80_9GAMM|nr:hypothetical protein C7H08_17075 [Marinobacter halophilus]GGC75610.1 hypothetical protein GCM10011362_25210 [Marinobacter halophilus]